MFVNKIAIKFQWLYLCFRVRQHDWNSVITVRCQSAVSISGLVVAILDSRLPVSFGRFGQSSDELLYPDDMGVAVEILLVSCIQARYTLF